MGKAKRAHQPAKYQRWAKGIARAHPTLISLGVLVGCGVSPDPIAGGIVTG